MRKSFIYLFIAFALMLGACAEVTEAPSRAPSQMPIAQTPVPSSIPTTPPDYIGTDFSGLWYVAGLLASDGTPVGEDKLKNMGSGFALELLSGAIYFVYDSEGKLLGQGDYSVEQNLLTLSAGDKQTVYEIQSENTLHCVLADNSITIMKRRPKQADGNDGETDDVTEEDAATTG